jgi:hypothetical protein
MKFKKLLSIVVVILLLSAFCVNGSAAVYSSAYIQATGAYITVYNTNTIKIHFNINGCGTMDKLGAAVIDIYKSDGTWVRTCSYTNPPYSDMMAYNTFVKVGSITCPAEYGETYYAIVTFYAEKDGGCDSFDHVTAECTVI